MVSLPSGVTMRGRKRCHSRADRIHVHVVVVVVGDEHGVDGRQVVEGDARRVHALGAGKRDRAGALRPDRIDEHALAARLDQKARVPDVGDAQPLAIETRRRTVGWKGAGKARRPRLAAVTELPLEERAGSPRADAARVEEAHAVEMIRGRTLVIGVGAAAGQQCPAAGAGGRTAPSICSKRRRLGVNPSQLDRAS